MLCKMKAVFLLLLLISESLASPTIEDNKIPTDEEILGQPEVVASLNLPTDEESFNHLSVFFNPSKPTGPIGSGTYHFVSSTFPEIDARGFHESVFDGIGDYFPSWPAPYKRQETYPFSPTLAQKLGLRPHNKFRKRSDTWADHLTVRRKRITNGVNNSREIFNKSIGFSKHLALEVDSTDEQHGDKHKESKHTNSIIFKSEPNMSAHILNKRSGGRYNRGMEMGSMGFHGDVFNGDFGDFTTMRKRARGSMGFHGDTFSDGFGDFATMKRSPSEKQFLSALNDYVSKLPKTAITDDADMLRESINRNSEMTPEEFIEDKINGELTDSMKKRRPEMDSMGFHGDTFSRGFGEFEPFKKRRASSGSMGFHGDTFSQGFGDFATYKKRKPEMDSMGFHGDAFSRDFGEFEPFKKRRPAAGSMGFHGDTFSQGFGDFNTLKKRRPEMDSAGFHGDTFSRGFGDFEAFKKRIPVSGSMGFHGDTFSQGFGDFDTFKKRRPVSGSMGFHGDTFSQGFGDFDTYKKRRPATGSMGFHGDTFSQGFGDFDTYKKRRPEMDSTGFHGDTFSRGFGEFEPFKKRRAAAGSKGFHGDTFNEGFGGFDTYKKRKAEMGSMGLPGHTFNRGVGEFDVYKKGSSVAAQEELNSQDTAGIRNDKNCGSDCSTQRHQDTH